MVIAVAFGVVAGALHVGFWVMESLLWRQPRIWKRFGVRSQDDADLMAFGMLNQGYYNLFLGSGAIIAAILTAAETDGGELMLGFACLFMLGAAAVLVIARPAMWQAGLVQGGPPAVAILGLIAM